MSDLVKRLRAYHREVVELDDGECPATAMVREAADEIERLRGLLNEALVKLIAPEAIRRHPDFACNLIPRIRTALGAADQPSSASGEGET